MRVVTLTALVVGSASAAPTATIAQVPDTVPEQAPDTVPAEAAPRPARDTAGATPDTARMTPRPPDRFTGPPAQDTAAPDTAAADSLIPPPTLPELPRAGPPGWAAGVWEWNREALLLLPDLTLLQLLERVPGLTPVRAAFAGHPETAAVMGGTAGAIRYVFDGFELDPLVAPTFDASRLSLLSLESVRVERRVTGATVHIETLTPTDARPHTIIEAATGDFDTNLFRGTFLTPDVVGGSLGLGFERLGTDVLQGSNHLSGWVKWTFVRDSSGVQFELRQGSLDRTGVEQEVSGARRDWLVRARTRFGPVAAEGYAGASSQEDEEGDLVIREGTPQAGVRLHSRLAAPLPVELTAALRVRKHPRLPAQELEVGAWTAPRPWLALDGQLVHARWDGGTSTGRWDALARVGPFLGLTGFAGVYRSGSPLGDSPYERIIPGVGDAETLAIEREGARAGAELQWGGLTAGAAVLRTRAPVVPGFGLAFDPAASSYAGGEATGVEATLRLPTFVDPVWLEGWYVGLESPEPWPYLPRHHWRAALVYHQLPLPSGNLELYARVEHAYRGAMWVPGQDALERVGSFRATNFELVIRVVSVRAFLRWDNLRTTAARIGQRDLPNYPSPGQQVSYGVKWDFWN